MEMTTRKKSVPPALAPIISSSETILAVGVSYVVVITAAK